MIVEGLFPIRAPVVRFNLQLILFFHERLYNHIALALHVCCYHLLYVIDHETDIIVKNWLGLDIPYFIRLIFTMSCELYKMVVELPVLDELSSI